MAVFEDFQKITPLRGGEDCKAPIVNDQDLHAGDGFENALMSPITTGEGKGFEHAWRTLIEDRSPVRTSLVAKSAGDPAFAEARRSGYQQVLMTRDPTAIRKKGHDTAVQTTGCAKIKIFDAGILAQGGELEARGQLLAVAFCGFSVNKQAEALFKLQAIEGG